MRPLTSGLSPSVFIFRLVKGREPGNEASQKVQAGFHASLVRLLRPGMAQLALFSSDLGCIGYAGTVCACVN